METASSGLFCQLIVIPLFNDHKLLTQVAGHGNHTIKLLPALTISDEDCGWIEQSFDAVIAGAHRTTGAVWKLGKTLVGNAVRADPLPGLEAVSALDRFVDWFHGPAHFKLPERVVETSALFCRKSDTHSPRRARIRVF